jgi:hypothetical protein
MNRTHRTIRRAALASVVATVAVLAGAPALAAQNGNLSDVSGTMITTGDLLAGRYQTAPQPTFTLTCSGAFNLRMVAEEVSDWYVASNQAPALTQAGSPRFAALGTPVDAVAADRPALLVSLVRGNEGAYDAANGLVDELDRLLTMVRAIDPRQPDPRVAAQVASAVESFNAFVMASDTGYLASAPTEFLLVHGTLGALAAAVEGNAAANSGSTGQLAAVCG